MLALRVNSPGQSIANSSDWGRADRDGRAWLRNGVLSVLLLLLFREWLNPIIELSDITQLYMLKPLLFAFGCIVLINYLFSSPIIAGVLMTLLSLCVVGYLFHSDSSFLLWPQSLVQLIMNDVSYIVQGQADQVSAETRTLLFLLGWAFVIYAVQWLAFQKHQILWFIAASLIYLLVLQLFLGTDTRMGLVRTTGIGLMLLSCTYLPQLEQTYGIRRGGWWPWSWIVAAVIIVGAVVGIGYEYAQREPVPAEPVHWFDRFGIGDFTSVAAPIQRTGYSSEDVKLGGALQEDTTIAFTAKSPLSTYWRGESKSFYDGKGWTEPVRPQEERALYSDLPNTQGQSTYLSSQGQSTNLSSQEQMASEVITQEVVLSGGLPGGVIFSGGSVMRMEALVTDKGQWIAAGTLLLDPASGRLAPEVKDAFTFYKVKVSVPKPDPSGLRQETGAIPQEIAAANLQLPAALPERVKLLAQKVVAGVPATAFDRASAVAAYLRSNYAYDRQRPGYPVGSRDFVDQFLFSQKLGYCDHFSTAMVVMLRSIGIPARWVKGFAPGDAQAAGAEEANTTYVIRNKDAHSWVEVYFPLSGWVAFDPTPGFSGLSSTSSTDGLQQTALSGQPASTEQTTTAALNNDLANAGSNAGSSGSITHSMMSLSAAGISKLLQSQPRRYLTIVVGVLLLTLIGWITQKIWFPRFILRHYLLRDHNRFRRDPKLVLTILNLVWRQIFRKFGQIKQHQTVREYMFSLNQLTEEQQFALERFVQIYESVRYCQPRLMPAVSQKRIYQLWKEITS